MNLKLANVKRQRQFRSKVCPLAEHIDLKDHYLAFIELENFGISSDLPDERCQFLQSLGINSKLYVLSWSSSPELKILETETHY